MADSSQLTVENHRNLAETNGTGAIAPSEIGISRDAAHFVW
jgi:hypothetical protein